MAENKPGPVTAAHPTHAIVLAGPFPLAFGALLSDWAYSSSYQIQWINFADWLVAGSLLFGALALVASIVSLTFRRRWRDRDSGLALGFLLLFMVFQFVNALTHSKDAFATMPAALILSVLATVLALAAAWLGLSVPGRGAVR